MKWVKVAIGAVIAIISIGIIATSVYGMTQENVKGEVVTFEVLTETTVTQGTYSKINEYAVFIENNATNILNITINGTSDNIVDGQLTSRAGGSYYIGDNSDDDPSVEIFDNDAIDEYSVTLVGDVWEITFEVTTPAQLTGITATLILLTPLIFAGGVLAYLLNKQEF